MVVGAALLVAAGWWASAPGEEPVRFHPDPEELSAAAGDALLGMLVGDMPTARAALDRIEKISPRYPVEAREQFGATMTNVNRAFHTALSVTREQAGAGEWNAAFASFGDVLSVCRGCHVTAREEDRWPPPKTADH